MIHLSGVSALQIEDGVMTQRPRIRNVPCVSCKYADAACEDGHGLCVSNQRVTHVKTPLQFAPDLQRMLLDCVQTLYAMQSYVKATIKQELKQQITTGDASATDL